MEHTRDQSDRVFTAKFAGFENIGIHGRHRFIVRLVSSRSLLSLVLLTSRCDGWSSIESAQAAGKLLVSRLTFILLDGWKLTFEQQPYVCFLSTWCCEDMPEGEWRGNVVGGVVEGYRLRSSLLVWAADWAGYPFAQNPYRIIKHVIYKAASSSRGQQHSLHDPSYLGINLLSVWKSHQSSKKHGCYRLWRWRCFIEKRKNFYSIPHRVFIDTQKEKEKERWAWEVQNVKSFSQPRSCCINLVILQCVPSSPDLHIYIIRLQKEL